MSSERLRAVTCQACGYLALKVIADIMDLGPIFIRHMQQAGCGIEAMLAHPLDAPERLRTALEATHD